ncbi:hypothetical protein EJ110_NYTH37491 [Nymphaea thermarum]|nr:hypothetical protein EJ110_NYTH37491 [Nymphaea thermarum]
MSACSPFINIGKTLLVVLSKAFLTNSKDPRELTWWSLFDRASHFNFYGLDSSYKVWTAIKRIYAAQSRAKVQQLKSALQNLKKGNESITTYFHKAKGVAHQLVMASKPVDEEDLVMNIISGLPTDEYGTLKVSLRTRVEPINLEELYSLLLIQESEISKSGNVEDPSAYVAY